MENQIKPKPKLRHPDRVTMTPDSLTRITEWVEEVEQRGKGIRITKSDLVNYLISSRPKLSEQEMRQLEIKYYDDSRFLAWALRQIKEAKAQGRKLTLEDLMETGNPLRKENSNEK